MRACWRISRPMAPCSTLSSQSCCWTLLTSGLQSSHTRLVFTKRCVHVTDAQSSRTLAEAYAVKQSTSIANAVSRTLPDAKTVKLSIMATHLTCQKLCSCLVWTWDSALQLHGSQPHSQLSSNLATVCGIQAILTCRRNLPMCHMHAFDGPMA